ncbi:MAG: hypothetical protein BWX80_03410 [Candidatus Hydrogenedentes bacterium ADurb.Bin101]|nr:MAG: hypothetical protein BWX80_03410 [Candidatus Hydrogenedentes bacterium ADurb.Bin101]
MEQPFLIYKEDDFRGLDPGLGGVQDLGVNAFFAGRIVLGFNLFHQAVQLRRADALGRFRSDPVHTVEHAKQAFTCHVGYGDARGELYLGHF